LLAKSTCESEAQILPGENAQRFFGILLTAARAIIPPGYKTTTPTTIGWFALAARPRRRITVRCNRLSCGAMQ
jgi:hypothetical protein